MQISAVRLSKEAFAPFGDYWPQSGARTGKGYAFSSALYPAFRGADDEEPSLGITVGEALDVATARMERHFHTTETLFTIATPIVLAVAPPGGEAPLADEVVAFLLNPGDVVPSLVASGTMHVGASLNPPPMAGSRIAAHRWILGFQSWAVRSPFG